jgi:hypothetical protein
MLFQAALPKLPGPVRTALQSLIGRIRQTIETTTVYNAAPVVLPRGMIVSYYQDPTKVVRPTSDSAPDCQEQYVGVLEADIPAAPPLGPPTVGLARHDGGPVYVAMETALTDIHVGDSVWATTDAPGGYGQLITGLGINPPIYVGMIEDLYNYDDTAPSGTTGVLVVLKHQGPAIPN